MAGGKHKGIGWNLFKRPQRKQRLPENGSLDSGLQQSQSTESSKLDAFSVSSVQNDVSITDTEQGFCLASEHAVDDHSPPISPSTTTDADNSNKGSSFAPSFDSPFVSAVEVDLDGPSFGIEASATNCENQEIIIKPRLQVLESNMTDLEDFESVCFDPVFSQTVGSSKSSSLLWTTQDADDSDDDEVSDDPSLFSEKENDSHVTTSSSEYKSPLNYQEGTKTFVSPEAEEHGVDENINTDIPGSRKKEKSNSSSKVLTEEKEAKPGLPQPSPSRAKQYRSMIYAKTRKSRPFRSRLRNVLATKSPSNAAQQHASPSAFSVRSISVDSPLGSPSPNQKFENPNGDRAGLSVKTTKPTTTPRSQKLWAKSATPRSTKADSAPTMEGNPQSPLNNKTVSLSKANEDQSRITFDPTFESTFEQKETQVISHDSFFAENKENGNISIEGHMDTTKSALASLSMDENLRSPARPDTTARATTFSPTAAPQQPTILKSKSEAMENPIERQGFEVENLPNGDGLIRETTPCSRVSEIEAEAVPEDDEIVSVDETKELDIDAALLSPAELNSMRSQLSLTPPPPPPLPGRPPKSISVTKPDAAAKVTNNGDDLTSFDDVPQVESQDKEESADLNNQLCSETDVFQALNIKDSMNDVQVGKDLFAATSQTEMESIEFPSFDFEGSFQSMNDESLQDTPSLERENSQVTDSLPQVKTETSTDVSDTGETQTSFSKLRKSFSKGKMRFIGGKQKKKGFPLPRHPSHSADSTDETAETPLVEWFDSKNGSSDVSVDDKSRKDAWGSSIAMIEVGQVEPGKAGMRAETPTSSGIIKVATTGKTPSSDLIFWSGETEDFEVVAVAPSEQLAAAGQSWVDGAASDDVMPPKVLSKSTPRLPRLPNSARKSAGSGPGLLQTLKSEQSQHSGSNFTGPSGFKRAPNSFSTPRTTNAIRGVGRTSPRTSGILAMLGQPGVHVKAPQIGDTIDTDLYVSACSTLSGSDSSDGSCSSSSCSGSSSSSGSSACSEYSGASNSAILTVSELGIQEAAAFANTNSLLGHNFSQSRGSTTFLTRQGSSSSDSDDDVFSSIDEASSVEDTKAAMSMASENNSFMHGFIASSASGDSSSSDSQTEFDDVEAHVQMAQEWILKMKSAFLGHNNKTGHNDDESTTIDNTVQCEYAGVLGRFKIGINQNKSL